MSEPLRVFVVDDEVAAREELKYLLQQVPDVEVVGEAGDALEARARLARLAPDLAFLDIRLPGVSGLELAERLRQESPSTQVVFATAYDQHAVEAFDLAATDYVLKPFEAERVALAVARARRERDLRRAAVEQRPAGRLAVERLRRTVFLDLPEVAWIRMVDGLVTVAALDGTQYTIDETLRDLEGRLDPEHFFRCHREAIVNLARVREVQPQASGTFRLVLDDAPGSAVPLARNRARTLRKILPF